MVIAGSLLLSLSWVNANLPRTDLQVRVEYRDIIVRIQLIPVAVGELISP